MVVKSSSARLALDARAALLFVISLRSLRFDFLDAKLGALLISMDEKGLEY